MHQVRHLTSVCKSFSTSKKEKKKTSNKLKSKSLKIRDLTWKATGFLAHDFSYEMFLYLLFLPNYTLWLMYATLYAMEGKTVGETHN